MLCKKATEHLLLKIRKSVFCRMKDYKAKALYKQIEKNEIENRRIKERMHGQFHKYVENKKERKKLPLNE